MGPLAAARPCSLVQHGYCVHMSLECSPGEGSGVHAAGHHGKGLVGSHCQVNHEVSSLQQGGNNSAVSSFSTSAQPSCWLHSRAKPQASTAIVGGGCHPYPTSEEQCLNKLRRSHLALAISAWLPRGSLPTQNACQPKMQHRSLPPTSSVCIPTTMLALMSRSHARCGSATS